MSITSSSVLVELNIRVWQANKVDQDESAKLIYNNAAVKSAAQVRKNLMAGTALRKDIANFAAQARLFHKERSLPWADRGSRLLPTSLFLDYKKDMNAMQTQFYAMVDNFVDKYPILVQTAQSNMGSLFKPEDYPSVDEVRNAFEFKLTFTPVPSAGDFRLDVSAAELAELSEQYEASFSARLAEAMREPWEKLHQELLNMSDKLTDQEGKDKRYHDALVDNAVSLCGMLTHLNLANDPKLEAARQQLEAALVGANMDMIRESATTRANMKDKVDSILKQFEW